MPLLTVTMIRSSNVIHRTELSTDANPFQDVKTELQGIKDKPFSSTWSLLYTMINNGTSSRVVQTLNQERYYGIVEHSKVTPLVHESKTKTLVQHGDHTTL